MIAKISSREYLKETFKMMRLLCSGLIVKASQLPRLELPQDHHLQ